MITNKQLNDATCCFSKSCRDCSNNIEGINSRGLQNCKCVEKLANELKIYKKALEDLTPILNKYKYAWVYELLGCDDQFSVKINMLKEAGFYNINGKWTKGHNKPYISDMDIHDMSLSALKDYINNYKLL